MKQTARIAQNRCCVLVELLYIHLTASRPRLSSSCIKVICCHKTSIIILSTHLSGAKVSDSRSLLFSCLGTQFLSLSVLFRLHKNQNLKIIRHVAETNVYKYFRFGSRHVVPMSMCHYRKLSSCQLSFFSSYK